jgi:DNA/RNA endonuclease YhcR with UshA esterase domain
MNDQPSAAPSPTGSGTVCPSCGRFVGAYERCPYCGTGVQKRIPMRALRATAVLVALGGIVSLHLMAMHREIPVTAIGEITPSMNFGYVSVVGRATGPLRLYREGDKISRFMLFVDDDTGELRVQGYRQVAEMLAEEGVNVRQGDKVRVSGTLRVFGDDNVSMLLQVPQHLQVIETNEASRIALRELGGLADGQPVRVQARIAHVSLPRSERAPYQVTLADGTDEVTLVVWPAVFEQIPEQDKLVSGALVSVRAARSSYRDQPQLTLEMPQDLQVLAQAAVSDVEPVAPAAPDAESVAFAVLGPSDVSRMVAIKARVVDVRAPGAGSTAPYTVELDDGTTTLPMVIWPSTYAGISDAAQLVAGARVSGQVLIGEYRGRLQLELRNADALTITPAQDGQAAAPVTRAAVGSAPSPKTVSGIVTPDEAIAMAQNTRVTVRGFVDHVVLPTSERAPYRIMLAGERRPVTMVCWDDTYSAIPDASRPVSGAVVKVSVLVSSYNGYPQLRLESASDYALESVRGGAKPPAPAEADTARTSITPADLATTAVGTPVTLEGVVENMIPSTGERVPYRISVAEDGNVVTVVTWPDNWETVPVAQRPVTNARVRVRGEVSEYRGTRQITVAEPDGFQVVQ